MSIIIRRIESPQDPAIPAFGRLQDRVYAESDLLIPARYIPMLLARQTAERSNCMLVAEDAAGQVVGGTIFHYFTKPNTGFSSFLAVDPNVRGQGLARKLHEARFAVLDAEAGEQAPVAGVFIDVVAPGRMTPAEVEAELGVGADPVARRRIFHRLGFRRVDVAYYQPPDGPNEEPITTMDLLYCPREPQDYVATDAVVGTMHKYWTPWLGRHAADAHSDELRRRCGGEKVVLKPA